MAKKEVNFQSILSKYSAEKEEEFIPTGYPPLDKMLGGGINPGAMYAAWGVPGSFKTTISLQIAKAFLRKGLKVLFLDVEKALNKNQQEAFGIKEFVENGMLIHVTADTYAQADEICMALAADNSNEIKLVIIDSDTQLLPKIGEDAAVDSNQPGTKARQCSVFLTKTKSAFYRQGISSLILCHARANINMQSMYGPATKMAGGYATQHIPDVVIQFAPGQKFGTDKTAPEGVEVHMQTDKNKFAEPFKRYDIKCFYGFGLKRSVCLIDEAIEQGLITQNGSFFGLPDGTSVRGRESLYSLSSLQLNELAKTLGY